MGDMIRLQRLDGTLIVEYPIEECPDVRSAVERAVRGGISLRSADLRWSDLRGADLRGARLASGAVTAVIASGDGTLYPWRLWRMADGSPLLALGCEEHPLDWWGGEDAAVLVARHGGSASRLAALVAYCRVLAGEESRG